MENNKQIPRPIPIYTPSDFDKSSGYIPPVDRRGNPLKNNEKPSKQGK